ncbi:hypothetical protein LTR95_001126 [Oleoguttula sp. CCFEE 5521]
MAAPEEYDNAYPKICSAWLLRGECGPDQCDRRHHNNLRPGGPRIAQVDISTELGTSCHRCLQRGLVCDKKGRGEGGDDPCSECRWFLGDDTETPCTISSEQSVSDGHWHTMCKREGNGHTLSDWNARHKIRGNRPKKGEPRETVMQGPQPMSATKLKANWSGQTLEQLTSQADPLPPDVRAHPRAYLLPPHDNHEERRNKRKAAEHAAEEASHSSLPSVSSGPAQPQFGAGAMGSNFNFGVPSFGLPAQGPSSGGVVSSYYDQSTQSLVQVSVHTTPVPSLPVSSMAAGSLPAFPQTSSFTGGLPSSVTAGMRPAPVPSSGVPSRSNPPAPYRQAAQSNLRAPPPTRAPAASNVRPPHGLPSRPDFSTEAPSKKLRTGTGASAPSVPGATVPAPVVSPASAPSTDVEMSEANVGKDPSAGFESMTNNQVDLDDMPAVDEDEEE